MRCRMFTSSSRLSLWRRNQTQLEQNNYPYDISYMRWSGHGDNAIPDPAICEFIKDWNSKYAYPRFVISSTSEAFREFEQRFGSRIRRRVEIGRRIGKTARAHRLWKRR